MEKIKSKILENGTVRVWTGNPVGAYAFAEGYKDADGKLYVVNITVDNPLQRRGLGLRLIDRLMKETRTRSLVVENIQKGSEGFWKKILTK